MNLHTAFFGFIVWITFGLLAHAQTNTTFHQADQEVKWSVTTTFLSEYLARPGFDLYDEPVSQSEIVVAYRGFYIGSWFSQGLAQSQVFNYNQESQTYLGFKKALYSVTLDGSIRYDAFKELSSVRDDLLMVDLRADFTKVPFVQPYVTARYFQAVAADKPGSGWFVWFGARRIQDLGFSMTKAGHVSFVADASIAYSSGALSRDSGWVYGRLLAQANIPLRKGFMITPQLLTQFPLDERGFGHRSYTDGTIKFVWGVSLNYKF